LKMFCLDNNSMAETICIKLGKRIRSLRNEYGLTQEELAANSGISTKYLQNLEGKRPKTASIITLEKLTKGFGIPIWKLLR